MTTPTPTRAMLATILAAGALLAAAPHVTPPVVLVSDREAVREALEGGDRFFVREVRLSDAERERIRERWDWKPEEDYYRFYLGRDAGGELVAAAVFLKQTTIHGPVRVLVALRPDGTVRQARVVELTEETYAWLEPVLEENLTDDYVGYDSGSDFRLSERFREMSLPKMPRFYAEIVVELIERGAALYDVAFLQSGEAG